MFKKVILIAVIFFNFFIPTLASADVSGANSKIPELNPFCWKRKDCWFQRAQYLTGVSAVKPSESDKIELNKGFVSNQSVAPCVGGGDPAQGEDWGRCLPAGVTETEISFGGRSSFSNIGDFILEMYNWLVTVASIVAVIVIIVAGIQWITSGGNSEAISSAKHRISGAVVGLFIAYMSYFILNTINPNLVNFRVPQVWLVRPQNMIPEFCSDIPNYKNINFAYVLQYDTEGQPMLSNNNSQTYFKRQDEDLLCGSEFLAENGGQDPCTGHFCKKHENRTHMCISMRDAGYVGQSGYGCVQGELLIHLSAQTGLDDQLRAAAGNLPIVGAFVDKALETEWINPTGEVLRAVCKAPDMPLFLANFGGDVKLSSFIEEFLSEEQLAGYNAEQPDDEFSRRRAVSTKAGELYPSYLNIYSGLADQDKIKKYFHCYVPKDTIAGVSTGLVEKGEVVGYFIRYEVEVNRTWSEKYLPAIQDAAFGASGGAGVGAAIGWFGGPIGSGAGFLIGGGLGATYAWINDPGNPEPNLNVGYDQAKKQAIYGLFANQALRERRPEFEDLAAIKSLDNYIPLEALRAPAGLRLKIVLNSTDLAKIMTYRGSVPQNDSFRFWESTSVSTTSP